MTANDKPNLHPFPCSNVTSSEKGLTFSPFNCFYFIEEKKPNFFSLIIKCRLELSFIDKVNSQFKFKVNDDETILGDSDQTLSN